MAIASDTQPGRQHSLRLTRELRAVLVSNLDLDRGNQQPTAERSRRHRFSMGLSLAESLNLVLFLIMVVLGVRLTQLQGQATDAQRASEALQAGLPALRPVLDRFQQSRDFQTEAFDQMVVKLTRAIRSERAAADLARENSELRAQLAAHKAARSEPRADVEPVAVIASEPQTSTDDPAATADTLSGLELLSRKAGPEVPVAEPAEAPTPKSALLEGDSVQPQSPQSRDAGGLAVRDLAANGPSAPAAASPKGVAAARRLERRPECESRRRFAAGAGGQVSFWCP